MDKFEFLHYGDKSRILFNDSCEEFKPKERHWVLIRENYSKLREEVLQNELVYLLGRIGVSLRVVDLTMAEIELNHVCEKFESRKFCRLVLNLPLLEKDGEKRVEDCHVLESARSLVVAKGFENEKDLVSVVEFIHVLLLHVLHAICQKRN